MESIDLKRNLGLRLKELRKAKGLRQEDLEQLGFSYRFYGRLERGLGNPTLETLARLSEIFEVSLEDLFSFLDTGTGATEDRAAVAVKVAKILKGKNKKKIQRLKVFLDEIL